MFNMSSNEKLKLVHKNLIATLLSDPEKKAKVLELLTHEGLVSSNENFSPNSMNKYNSPVRKLKKKNDISSVLSPKNGAKNRIESPSALGRRRALQRLESDSSVDDPPEKLTSPPMKGPEVPFNEILKDVIVYCEVRTNGEDRSASIKTMVAALGATVREKITRDVTHVIFKDGLYSTFRKAQNMKMHIVSVLWLDAVRRYKCRVPEEKYKSLDMDKYTNMQNQSLICQELQDEFNDVVRDEVRRSAVKVRDNPHTPNRFVTERKRSSNLQQSMSDVLNNSHDNDYNRVELSTPVKSRSVTPAISESDSCISDDLITNQNNNNEPEIVPCSQTTSFSHKRHSDNFNKSDENRVSSPKMIAKLVRDSLELEKVQKIKSPEILMEKQLKSKQSIESKISLNENDESLRLHITTTTDQSCVNTTGNRTRSLSSGFAQKIVSSDNAKSNSTKKNKSKINNNSKKIDDNNTSSDLNRVSTSTRSSASSTDLLNGPTVIKARRKTTIGLSRSRKSSINSNHSNTSDTNKNLNNKLDNLINDVDKLLNNEADSQPKENVVATNNLNTNEKSSTAKKPKARKLFNAEYIDESLFNWDQVTNGQEPKSPTPPKKLNYELELPKDFPKTLSSKARKKASTNKKSSTVSKIMPANNIKTTRRSAKLLEFGEKSPDKKITSNTENNDEISNNLNTIPEKLDTNTPRRGKRKSDTPNVKSAKKSKSPTKNKNIPPTSTTDLQNTELKEISSRPKRKSTNQNNYQLDTTNSQDEIEETIDLDKSNESYKTASSSSIIDRKKRRKSQRIMDSSETDCADSNNDEINNCDTEASKEVKPKESQIVKDTPKSKVTKKILSTPNTLQKKVLTKTPVRNKLISGQVTPNRRSTLEFLPRSSRKSMERLRSTQKSKTIPPKISSIVCTRFHKSDVQVFQQIVKKIGGFIIEDEVTKRTTHLVCSGPSRTVNLLRAIARGCWVLRKEWLYKSLEAGYWLEEEDYEMTEFSPAVQKCRLEKQTFGPLFSMDIFKNCGTIFISRGSAPRFSDLEELVELCGGRIVRTARDADIIVAENDNTKENTECVSEKWILDSISNNKKKAFKHYRILSSPE